MCLLKEFWKGGQGMKRWKFYVIVMGPLVALFFLVGVYGPVGREAEHPYLYSLGITVLLVILAAIAVRIADFIVTHLPSRKHNRINL